MERVAESLITMGPEQLLLVLILLGSYAQALGEFVSLRIRVGAVVTALLATAGFAAMSVSWEAGVILMTLVPVGMALFAAGAWTLWTVAMWRGRRLPAVAPEPVDRAPRRNGTASILSRLWSRLRFI